MILRILNKAQNVAYDFCMETAGKRMARERLTFYR